MLDKIIDKVSTKERSLVKKHRTANDSDNTVRVISTYGRDEELVNILQSADKLNDKVNFSYVKSALHVK